MTKEECKKLVLDIIADIAPAEDLSNIKSDVRLRDQLQLDSMDFFDIVMELRKQYRVQIPEEDYHNLGTMTGTVTYLTPLMKGLQAHA
jgi:acyl carrier protein